MSELISLDGFDCAPAHRIASNERINSLQFEAMSKRLDRVEEMMERLEKRLWLIVFGVVGVILAQAFQSVLAVTP
ncbi:GTA head formation protein, RCAP_rcc01685 family [Parasulfitobacter algicola]|uniref:Gene transfer agent protein n=1 Tax=Parasulfitobacter algicola TaxID=2614809 RepID=A0ABX2IZR7_9RHOB|nr:hypothetical protein [Sulfitobacter algicola]NSX56259.1 hypothetical protein [Sulfitobacter algicola]